MLGSYKPGLAQFKAAVVRLAERGYPKDSILPVAQNRHHDVESAGRLGIPTVWANWRHGQPGTGATIANAAEPFATA